MCGWDLPGPNMSGTCPAGSAVRTRRAGRPCRIWCGTSVPKGLAASMPPRAQTRIAGAPASGPPRDKSQPYPRPPPAHPQFGPAVGGVLGARQQPSTSAWPGRGRCGMADVVPNHDNQTILSKEESQTGIKWPIERKVRGLDAFGQGQVSKSY